MGTFQLTAGTIVKHGTTASRLAAILNDGLTSAGKANASRGMIEPPPMAADGVYCGLFTAYFGAYAAFAAYAHDVLSWSGHKPIQEFHFDYPIVLGIRLGHDVDVLADEDFLPALDPETNESRLFTVDKMRTHARMCWNRHRSCVLPRIPPDWITDVELLNMLPIFDPEPKAQSQFLGDLHLLACGVVQAQRLLTFKDTVDLWKSRVLTTFDGPSFVTKVAANSEGLESVRSYPLARADNRNAAHEAVATTYRELSRLSPEYGIRAVS